ncbi:phosphatidylserine decarboxylase [Bacteroidia bacterium]|nr:phosphatidylserine decarboxylase [Bacteroidia bacterium]
MTIHKEGYTTIAVVFAALAAIVVAVFAAYGANVFTGAFTLAAFVFWLFIVRFFRMPKRKKLSDAQSIFSPCDGKVVVIEKTFEPEYLQRECLQISVFMSPNNVHANWYPVSGEVVFAKHHQGKYLVAWHPKASTKNERTTVVINTGTANVLVRQIAGYVARRIVCYAKAGDKAEQNTQVGFIKFGSRVDVFLPLDVKVNVQIGDKVTGSQTVLAKW